MSSNVAMREIKLNPQKTFHLGIKCSSSVAWQMPYDPDLLVPAFFFLSFSSSVGRVFMALKEVYVF